MTKLPRELSGELVIKALREVNRRKTGEVPKVINKHFISPELENLFTASGGDAFEQWNTINLGQVRDWLIEEVGKSGANEVSLTGLAKIFADRLERVITHYEREKKLSLVLKLRELLVEVKNIAQ